MTPLHAATGVVQEAVLGRWGIDMLTDDADRPEDALVAFLSKLKDAIDQALFSSVYCVGFSGREHCRSLPKHS